MGKSEIEKIQKLGKKRNLKLLKYLATEQDEGVVESFSRQSAVCGPDAVAELQI